MSTREKLLGMVVIIFFVCVVVWGQPSWNMKAIQSSKKKTGESSGN